MMKWISVFAAVCVVGCGPSSEQVDAAYTRINVLAHCLDDVAEGVGDGSFEPKYAGCIDDILGNDDGHGFRELSLARLRVPVMDLLTKREAEFQEQIDNSALLAYQLLLGATAIDLRGMVQSSE